MSTFETKLDNVCEFIGLSFAAIATAALTGYAAFVVFQIITSY